MVSGEHPALRAAVTVVCAWELTALATRRIPTVSTCMWGIHPLGRAVLWAGVAVVLTDHFLTRRWT